MVCYFIFDNYEITLSAAILGVKPTIYTMYLQSFIRTINQLPLLIRMCLSKRVPFEPIRFILQNAVKLDTKYV